MKHFIKITFLSIGIFLLVFCVSSCNNSIEALPAENNAVANLEPTPVNKNDVEDDSLENNVTNVRIGDSEIQVVSRKSGNAKPLYFRPHENETTSSSATAEIVKKYGGTFVELKSKGERNIDFLFKTKKYTIDPNRIFSTAGIEKTLGGGSETKPVVSEVSKFVRVLFADFLTDKKLIIAVHNNTEGGNLSIESYKNNTDAAAVYSNPSRDADDFFYVTNEKYFNFLKNKGFNVVMQDNAKAADDGSLSVYCGKNNISYINVESEHGHLQQQIEMLGAIQEIIKQGE